MHNGNKVVRAAPHEEYTRRLTENRSRIARLAQIDEKISRGRLAVVVAGVGLWLVAIRPGALMAVWLLAPVLGFIALVLAHQRIRQASRQATRRVSFYENGLARLEDRWVGQGVEGLGFIAPSHPYARDLDLFGRGSLFALLCTARTGGGEQTLADWLRVPALPDEILARQAAVEELRGRLDLRESLALRGEDVRTRVHPDTLLAWAQMPPQVKALKRLRLAVLGLAVANVTTGIGWFAFDMSPLPFIAALVVSGVLSASLRSPIRRMLAGVAQAGRDLPLLADVLACFEAEHFVCSKLTSSRAALDTGGVPPSRQIARLGRLINLQESAKNQFFIPIAALMLWQVQTALAIEAWRSEAGASVARWLAAMSELEALCALGGYAYEHPRDPFPDIVTSEVCFVGEDLGHPLIADARCVRNSVRLEQPLQVLVVSGSNMSGKSTLLRTVGVNAVLAFAGAPVRARRLRISPLTVGATLRIEDSLQDGSSRFYAEVTRLGQLMTLAKGPLPLLFLLDEILHGTNSHDRQIGAEAVVREFIERGAIGLVTTHDLALAQVAETLAPRAVNVCFEDQFDNGALMFDYRMRPGVVQKSNALALMRSVGLEV